MEASVRTKPYGKQSGEMEINWVLGDIIEWLTQNYVYVCTFLFYEPDPLSRFALQCIRKYLHC